MGAGSRFQINRMHKAFGFGLTLATFPYSFTVGVSFAFWFISIGFGRPYDAA